MQPRRRTPPAACLRACLPGHGLLAPGGGGMEKMERITEGMED